MYYAFKVHEANFSQWCQDEYPGIPNFGQEFLKNLESPNFVPKLWRHQVESIKRTVYAFEILKWPDLLFNIVTGGGKIASQQPAAIDREILTQCGIRIVHRITSADDIRAVNALSQDYVGDGLASRIKQLCSPGQTLDNNR